MEDEYIKLVFKGEEKELSKDPSSLAELISNFQQLFNEEGTHFKFIIHEEGDVITENNFKDKIDKVKSNEKKIDVLIDINRIWDNSKLARSEYEEEDKKEENEEEKMDDNLLKEHFRQDLEKVRDILRKEAERIDKIIDKNEQKQKIDNKKSEKIKKYEADIISFKENNILLKREVE